MENQKNSFREDVPLIFACSGGSKEGEIMDLAARKLNKTGAVLMSCCSAVSGRIDNYLEKLKKDRRIILLDGCEKDCLSKTLKNSGFAGFLHIRLNDIGLAKGKAITDEAAVEKVVEYVKKAMEKPSIWQENSFSYHPTKDRFSHGN